MVSRCCRLARFLTSLPAARVGRRADLIEGGLLRCPGAQAALCRCERAPRSRQGAPPVRWAGKEGEICDEGERGSCRYGVLICGRSSHCVFLCSSTVSGAEVIPMVTGRAHVTKVAVRTRGWVCGIHLGLRQQEVRGIYEFILSHDIRNLP